MKFPEYSHITDEKVNALKTKITALGIDLNDIEEKFVKGSGKGGQKKNKSSTCVCLTHVPTGLSVRCQRERERSLNRFIALRALIEKLESHL